MYSRLSVVCYTQLTITLSKYCRLQHLFHLQRHLLLQLLSQQPLSQRHLRPRSQQLQSQQLLRQQPLSQRPRSQLPLSQLRHLPQLINHPVLHLHQFLMLHLYQMSSHVLKIKRTAPFKTMDGQNSTPTGLKTYLPYLMESSSLVQEHPFLTMCGTIFYMVV